MANQSDICMARDSISANLCPLCKQPMSRRNINQHIMRKHVPVTICEAFVIEAWKEYFSTPFQKKIPHLHRVCE